MFSVWKFPVDEIKNKDVDRYGGGFRGSFKETCKQKTHGLDKKNTQDLCPSCVVLIFQPRPGSVRSMEMYF